MNKLMLGLMIGYIVAIIGTLSNASWWAYIPAIFICIIISLIDKLGDKK